MRVRVRVRVRASHQPTPTPTPTPRAHLIGPLASSLATPRYTKRPMPAACDRTRELGLLVVKGGLDEVVMGGHGRTWVLIGAHGWKWVNRGTRSGRCPPPVRQCPCEYRFTAGRYPYP